MSVFIFQALITLPFTEGTFYTGFFKMATENLFDNTEFSFTTLEKEFTDVMSCGMFCQRDDSCISFGFNQTVCVLFKLQTSDQVGNIPSGEGFTFFSKVE